MRINLRGRKVLFIILGSLILVIILLVLTARPVKTNQTLPIENKKVQMENGKLEVLATKDKDGYGLQILVRGFKNVKKVEMLVNYTYKGKENPPLLASGTPQQDSYWAHFRFESCSRGDCLYYKVSEAKFQLTLNYQDGESKEYSSLIKTSNISQNSPLVISPL